MNIVKILTSFISGGIIGYLIKHVLDLRYERKIEEMNKKRAVYENLTATLSIFVSGRDSTDEQKKKFLDTYSKCWLWASDDVVKEIGDFLEYQIAISRGENIKQEDMKNKYASCLLTMRRDLGFSKTCLKEKDYKFVSFEAEEGQNTLSENN